MAVMVVHTYVIRFKPFQRTLCLLPHHACPVEIQVQSLQVKINQFLPKIKLYNRKLKIDQDEFRLTILTCNDMTAVMSSFEVPFSRQS